MGHVTQFLTGEETREKSDGQTKLAGSSDASANSDALTAAVPNPADLPFSDTSCDLVQVRIPGQPAYISVARQAIDAVSEQLQLPPDTRSAVKLAVGEACNNAVLYGRHLLAPAPNLAIPSAGGAPTVLIACRILRDALEIDVTNEGNGFHPMPGAAAMPMPETLSEHGRGLALMESVMDSVEYLSRNGNTVVRMRKRRPALPCAAAQDA